MSILYLIFSLLLLPVFAESAIKPGEFLGSKTVESLPNWFKTSFLDFSEDLSEALDENRHVMIYFHQNGCPYCAKLVEDNFHNSHIVDKLKKHFDVIQINMWGNRELTDWRGKELDEKEFASFMQVQFTPTLVFLNSKGDTVLRLNGYQSTRKMHAVLDYVSGKHYLNKSFANYTIRNKQNKIGDLNKNPLFEPPPHVLVRSKTLPAQKYLAVFFEEPNCASCDTFHRGLMRLEESKNLLKPMQVVQLNALSDEGIITPSGVHTTAAKWYDALGLTDKPAIVFFDKIGNEIIRKDGFFKAFHFHSIMHYVLSGAYQRQPNFQRYIEHRSDELRKQGITVDIWK